MAFDFGEFSTELSSAGKDILREEGFSNLPALLAASKEDIESLGLKRGELALVREKTKVLQASYKTGPMFEDVGLHPGYASTIADSGSRGGTTTLDQLLRAADAPTQGAHAPQAQGMCLRIVDFISTSLVVEEEVTLGGGVTLKMNTKPNLDKVTPAVWIAANARILRRLMETRGPEYDVDAYLTYTEMVGELATRYTWASVLLFDDEYRQRQARLGFQWGTEAPHLSTVVLRERQQQVQQTRVNGRPRDHQRRPTGPSGRELCRQYNNRGACQYGTACQFDHACHTCGRDHPGRDHAVAGAPYAAASAGTRPNNST
jgi:hypothetical protein